MRVYLCGCALLFSVFVTGKSVSDKDVENAVSKVEKERIRLPSKNGTIIMNSNEEDFSVKNVLLVKPHRNLRSAGEHISRKILQERRHFKKRNAALRRRHRNRDKRSSHENDLFRMRHGRYYRHRIPSSEHDWVHPFGRSNELYKRRYLERYRHKWHGAPLKNRRRYYSDHDDKLKDVLFKGKNMHHYILRHRNMNHNLADRNERRTFGRTSNYKLRRRKNYLYLPRTRRRLDRHMLALHRRRMMRPLHGFWRGRNEISKRERIARIVNKLRHRHDDPEEHHRRTHFAERRHFEIGKKHFKEHPIDHIMPGYSAMRRHLRLKEDHRERKYERGRPFLKTRRIKDEAELNMESGSRRNNKRLRDKHKMLLDKFIVSSVHGHPNRMKYLKSKDSKPSKKRRKLNFSQNNGEKHFHHTEIRPPCKWYREKLKEVREQVNQSVRKASILAKIIGKKFGIDQETINKILKKERAKVSSNFLDDLDIKRH